MVRQSDRALVSWNRRALAVLRAVAAGRAEISLSCEPDLFIDGFPCCDQAVSRALAHEGLVRPARAGSIGQRVPARITRAGNDLIASPPAAA
ncbi:MAG TPA: hypothetical protein VGR06_09705 [Actinophytocola sp.]|jgi:hypothetical protein|uniref:hypothetical protein n=1 Tax=Actinophytocola sp. TaxID=1872138 RepID=UPI002DFD7EAA|nr:hypothetical protein [Actinophytocola sp.]